ncbi:PBP1A family penicillin-binding protein [Desulfitobacterium sp.]|uniref:transglycosylase domain-containing protein n=1 Tax=Desulfitobacterium sp. TaxID=49981 RepID=UPI002C844701|nr:PBP1A family penicillin-binding protein [Desulfitobacterium sp.]HVJ48322.1 PBP1A family penicillin-binding protein [Desulfitobacterium sp.]
MASPPKKTTRSSRKKRLSKWRVFLLTSGSIIAVALIAILIFVISAIAKTPKWDPAALTNQQESSIVYDKDGEQIAALHADENRQIVKSSEIPDIVKKTFVAVEDKRFYSHYGVDPIRIVGSAINDIKSRSSKEGASTITIQLARNAFIEDPTSKNLTRKVQEVVLALQLEHEYTKDEILTFYLNRIFFGESSFGIQTAAKTYFGKDLGNLTPEEVALLAGLPQAPSGYDPYIHPDDAKNRRTIVLGVMKDTGIISSDEYNKAKDTPFTYVDNMNKNRASAQRTSVAGSDYKFPWFVDSVIQELEGDNYKLTPDQIFNGGLKIYTTVDSKIQAAAEAAFANSANFPQSNDSTKVQGAMSVLDPTTGAIRAVVGGREYTTALGFNRATQATRQPGSTIKPLVVYGPALEKGGFYPGTVLDDMPVSYNAGDGKSYSPVDFDTESSGWKGRITMRYAVENSVNVYAVKLMNLIGVDYGWSFGKDKLGLPLKNSNRVLSLALGTADVTTLDMASAYGTFANNGVRVTAHTIEKIQDSNGKNIITPQITQQRVMKETTSYLMNNLLRGVVTEGTGTRAQIGNWAVAGKTGTTSLPDNFGKRSGNKDAWFAGYTPNYVGVVWMGYDQTDTNHYLRNVYGGAYPAQIWKQVMTVALEDQPVQSEFKRPAGIVSGAIDTKSGFLPSTLTPSQFIQTEIAAEGNLPTQVSDIWVTKDIDADHPTYLAGDKTLNKVTKVFLNITDRSSSLSWPSDEAPFRAPTEYYTGNGEVTSLPTVDPRMPIPTLGPVAYDTAKGIASMPVSYPAGSEALTLVLYAKFPSQENFQPYTPQAQPGKSDLITVPLRIDGKSPSPGEYVFKAAFKDPKTSKYSETSPVAKLTIPTKPE